jgi:hypothetical protein
MAGRAGTEENVFGIILAAEQPVSQAFATELKQTVYEVMGEDTEVYVWFLRDAFIRQSQPEEKTR